ncbi:MAG: class I SAM-dependent methyltransferase [Gallionella sp.]|nr:class I SAM-dependent methyltransferase [Gallionella sp.]
MKWLLKLSAKVVLSRLGIPYELWRKAGLFRHGQMDSYEYAVKIFQLHASRAFPQGDLSGKTVLEIGPGDSLASAVIGRALGAGRIILVDAGRFATVDFGFYRSLAAQLSACGYRSPDLAGVDTLQGMLSACQAEYLTSGVSSFSELGDATVDYAWSHSVLEHIPKSELPELMAQLRRVLRPEGVMSHNIDFQDHLDYSLNSLRFSEADWEAPLMRGAGFYTNRVRATEMHQLIRSAGFHIVEEEFGRWPALPMPRKKLHPDFRGLSDDELRIRTSYVLARAAAVPCSGGTAQ